jgi:hypothetical protein
MAWGNFVLDKGFKASAVVTKFRAVKLTGAAETVGPIAAITDDPIGWLQFDISATDLTRGKDASVRVIGVTEAEASTAIAIGQRCTLDADGRVSALVAASGKRVVGLCVGTPAAVAGDRIAMLIHLVGPVA